MTWRAVTLLSVLLNLGLALAAWRLSPRPHPAAAGAPPAAPAAASTSLAPPMPSTARVVHTERESFDWSRLASPDLATYRDNLRGVGCPRSTLREILRFEVDQGFKARARALVQPYAGRFWDLLAEGIQDEKRFETQVEAVMDQLRALREERDTLLNDLLGEDKSAASTPPYERNAREDLVIEFLSPEKQAQFLALQAEFHQRRHAQGQEARAAGRGISGAERRALQQAQDAALQALFTPEEWAEYRRRTSNHADQIRGLLGLTLTEGEVRALVDVQIRADDARQQLKSETPYNALLMERYGLKPQDPMTAPAGTALQERTEDELQVLLGLDRYRDYQRARDGVYTQARRVTDRMGLDPALANDIYALSQEAQLHAKDVLNAPSLSAEERAAALRLLQDTSRATLQERLGTEVWDVYRRYGGDWWSTLGK